MRPRPERKGIDGRRIYHLGLTTSVPIINYLRPRYEEGLLAEPFVHQPEIANRS